MTHPKLRALRRERKALTKEDIECYLTQYDPEAWRATCESQQGRLFLGPFLAIRRLVQEIVRLRGW